MSSLFESCDGGVRVTLRVTPKAGRNQIQSVMRDAEGNLLLKVAVTDVPEDGKANKAVIKLLSKSFGIVKSDIAILSGETSRVKKLFMRLDAAAAQALIAELGLETL
ncbi:MAG: DUF167 domain-containing protein [Alphaproteobacteria bacterium]|nr:MAG: DUF167 domain-containing protein [Alphaproteobacteria bacterium]